MKEIILATSNQGKIAELEQIIHPIIGIPQAQLGIANAEESGLSFIENALIKARHASHWSKKPALADDSGLVVLALNGAPGIYSSRFAGLQATDKDNINLLLEKLKDIPDNQRQAFFYCAIAVVMHENDPTPIIATGKWLGKISLKPQGDLGFGYDPIFYLDQYQCTVAELPAKIKNRISHRAQALRQLSECLK